MMRILATLPTVMRNDRRTGTGPRGSSCTGRCRFGLFLDGHRHQEHGMMEKASQGDTAPAKEKMRQSHPMVTSKSCGRASLLGEASRILVTLGVRAAENHAVYCLHPWIAPSKDHGAKKPGLSLPQALMQRFRIGPISGTAQATNGREKLVTVLVDEGSGDDCSSSCR
jgi:hypothetical protein